MSTAPAAAVPVSAQWVGELDVEARRQHRLQQPGHVRADQLAVGVDPLPDRLGVPAGAARIGCQASGSEQTRSAIVRTAASIASAGSAASRGKAVASCSRP